MYFGADWGNTLFNLANDWSEYSIDEAKLQSRMGTRLFGSNTHLDENGFDAIYKTVCFDVDGIDSKEDPFGYGIRADGKIIYGNRAIEWMEKSIQSKD